MNITIGIDLLLNCSKQFFNATRCFSKSDSFWVSIWWLQQQHNFSFILMLFSTFDHLLSQFPFIYFFVYSSHIYFSWPLCICLSVLMFSSFCPFTFYLSVSLTFCLITCLFISLSVYLWWLIFPWFYLIVCLDWVAINCSPKYISWSP